MRTIIFILLASGLICIGAVQTQMGLPTDLSAIAILAPAEALAQVGSSISSDGTAPNNNAMLDVQSPATGDGKGILIPRVTLTQRTTANATLAGGLLDNSGNLRGGAAQGLIVYQTDGVQGLYFNTSQSATPSWVHLGEGSDLNMQGYVITNAVYYGDGRGITNLAAGAFTETDPLWASTSNAIVADIATRLTSNVWAAANSTTNYLPRTGGTMSGALNIGGQIVTNVAHIDFNGNDVSVGRGANGSITGAAVGAQANGFDNGVAVGASAIGTNYGVAVGYYANSAVTGAAVGASANGYWNGAAVGYMANGYDKGAAVGQEANGKYYGAAIGRLANGSDYGAAVGNGANGYNNGAALGPSANGYWNSVAVGPSANGQSRGVAVGYAAVGYAFGTAVGYLAAGTNYCVAIGAQANAQGGTEQIAIGHNVTNDLPNTARIRGTLYLDGGTGVVARTNFGSGAWFAKAFMIDHPLDPENKVLRHFCLEGPQVWNVYAGNTQLVNGQAVVQLPEYYSALNLVGSEVYSLTPVGRTQVWIEKKIEHNRFLIGGDKDVEVSWTIKVLRNDPGCREDLRRRPVEQMKSELETGN